MACAKLPALAVQRTRSIVAKAHPVVRRGDLGQATPQHGVPADGVEGVGDVDLEDDVLRVIFDMLCLHQALQPHSYHLCRILHTYSTMAGLEARHLFLHRFQSEEAFAHNPSEGLSHGYGSHASVLLGQRDQRGSAQHLPHASWKSVCDGHLREGPQCLHQ